jgi:stage II sporulation protein M
MRVLEAQWAALRAFWHHGYSEEVRRSAIAFAALALIGFVVCWLLPDLLKRITDAIFSYFGSLDVLDGSGKLSVGMLFANNLRACTVAILYGLIPFVYLSSLALGMNSLLLGVLAAYSVKNGYSMATYALALLPHGIFELPALILSFSMGLFLCGQITRRFRHDETAIPLTQCLIHAARLLLLLIVPLLTVAAVTEAYVTPLLLSLTA